MISTTISRFVSGLEGEGTCDGNGKRERERENIKEKNMKTNSSDLMREQHEGERAIISVSKARRVTETRLLDRVCKSINSSADRTNKSECNWIGTLCLCINNSRLTNSHAERKMNFKMDNVSTDRPPFASSLVNRSFTALYNTVKIVYRGIRLIYYRLYFYKRKKREKGKRWK